MWRLIAILAISATGLFLCLEKNSRADDETTADAVVDRALKAGGDVDKIRQFKAISFKGKVTASGVATPFSGYFAGPSRFRLETGARGQQTLVADGRSFWAKEGDAVPTELPTNSDEVRSISNLIHAISLPDRLLALKEKPYKLTIHRGKEVDEKCTVLRVIHEAHAETLLYFEKTSGLPIKAQVTVADMQDVEIGFDHYKDVNGVKHFTELKLVVDRQEMVFELSQIELLKTFDPDVFKKPG